MKIRVIVIHPKESFSYEAEVENNVHEIPAKHRIRKGAFISAYMQEKDEGPWLTICEDEQNTVVRFEFADIEPNGKYYQGSKASLTVVTVDRIGFRRIVELKEYKK